MKLTNKHAVITSINYPNTSAELYGCVNDGIHMIQFIKGKLRYPSQNIRFLNDKSSTPEQNRPTKQNIIDALNQAVDKVNKTTEPTEIWIGYSGHGTQIRDQDGDEVSDIHDEVIVPSDYKQSGFIADDILFNILNRIDNVKCKVMAIFDCCNSGTMLDLKHKYINGSKHRIENKNDHLKCKVYMISGCKDFQTSSDYFDHESNKYGGALTNAFLREVRPRNGIRFIPLINRIRRNLKKNRFTQVPQLTTNTRVDGNTFIYKKHKGGFTLFFQKPNKKERKRARRLRRIRDRRAGRLRRQRQRKARRLRIQRQIRARRLRRQRRMKRLRLK
jgi:hypothetical protein